MNRGNFCSTLYQHRPVQSTVLSPSHRNVSPYKDFLASLSLSLSPPNWFRAPSLLSRLQIIMLMGGPRGNTQGGTKVIQMIRNLAQLLMKPLLKAGDGTSQQFFSTLSGAPAFTTHTSSLRRRPLLNAASWPFMDVWERGDLSPLLTAVPRTQSQSPPLSLLSGDQWCLCEAVQKDGGRERGSAFLPLKEGGGGPPSQSP